VSESDRPGISRLGIDLDSSDWLDRLREARDRPPLGELGGYELLEEVGRGGQGIVYRARRGERIVAVKRILSGPFASLERRRRFEREVEAVRSLDHPGIVRVLDALSVRDAQILVMEWIDGVPVTEWAAPSGRRRPLRETVAMVRRACDALLYAHQHGVVHRDLKPSNLLVDAEGRPHLLDFGIAKLVTREGAGTSLTATGGFLGTLAYAAPEQIEGDPDSVDARADVHALGLVLFEMLTGRTAYATDGPISETIRALTQDEPPRPSSLAPDVDRALDAIVLKALAKDPARRYQSADALSRDLERFLQGEPVEAKGRSAAYVLGRLARRHRVATALTTGLALLVVGFGVTMAVLYQRSEREALRARRVQAFLETTLTAPGIPDDPEDSRGFLDHAAERLDVELAGEPGMEAGVRTALASRYARIGAWEEVAAHADRALELLDAAAADERARALRIRGLAAVHLRSGDAVERLTRAREAVLDLPEVPASVEAGLHANLALAYWRCSEPVDPVRARAEFRAAAEVYDRNPDVISWPEVTMCRDFACFLREENDPARAVEWYGRALARLDRLGEGTMKQTRIECLQGRAFAHQDLRRWPDAERDFTAALAVREGALDPSVPPCHANVGTARFFQERYADAIDSYEQAIVARLELLAETHPPARPEFVLLAADVRRRGLRPDAVPRIHAAIAIAEPVVSEYFHFTSGMIQDAHARLGHAETAAALEAARADLDATGS